MFPCVSVCVCMWFAFVYLTHTRSLGMSALQSLTQMKVTSLACAPQQRIQSVMSAHTHHKHTHDTHSDSTQHTHSLTRDGVKERVHEGEGEGERALAEGGVGNEREGVSESDEGESGSATSPHTHPSSPSKTVRFVERFALCLMCHDTYTHLCTRTPHTYTHIHTRTQTHRLFTWYVCSSQCARSLSLSHLQAHARTTPRLHTRTHTRTHTHRLRTGYVCNALTHTHTNTHT